jgi:hypothetical protein
MQTMAAIIDWYSIKLEAAGIASNIIALLKDSNFGFAVLRQLPGCAKSRRTSPQDRNVRSGLSFTLVHNDSPFSQ